VDSDFGWREASITRCNCSLSRSRHFQAIWTWSPKLRLAWLVDVGFCLRAWARRRSYFQRSSRSKILNAYELLHVLSLEHFEFSGGFVLRYLTLGWCSAAESCPSWWYWVHLLLIADHHCPLRSMAFLIVPSKAGWCLSAATAWRSLHPSCSKRCLCLSHVQHSPSHLFENLQYCIASSAAQAHSYRFLPCQSALVSYTFWNWSVSSALLAHLSFISHLYCLWLTVVSSWLKTGFGASCRCSRWSSCSFELVRVLSLLYVNVRLGVFVDSAGSAQYCTMSFVKKSLVMVKTAFPCPRFGFHLCLRLYWYWLGRSCSVLQHDIEPFALSLRKSTWLPASSLAPRSASLECAAHTATNFLALCLNSMERHF